MSLFRFRKVKAGLATSRIEAFSDGVFAIAITLLVLEISIPKLSHNQIINGELAAQLIDLWPKFVAFAISFGIISIYWVAHAIMFHFIKRSDRVLLWLNALLLLCVSFIPFPAALLGEYAPDKVAVVLYGATLCAAGFFFSLIWMYASVDRRLISENMPQHIVNLAKKVVWLVPAVYGVAVIVGFFQPVISIVIFILVPLFYVLPSPIDDIVDAAYENKE